MYLFFQPNFKVKLRICSHQRLKYKTNNTDSNFQLIPGRVLKLSAHLITKAQGRFVIETLDRECRAQTRLIRIIQSSLHFSTKLGYIVLSRVCMEFKMRLLNSRLKCYFCFLKERRPRNLLP